MITFKEFVRNNMITEGMNLQTVFSKNTMEDALRRKFVVFYFTKKEGERRKGFGTLRKDFTTAFYVPSTRPSDDPVRNGYKAVERRGYTKYYDLERDNFRNVNVKRGRVKIIATYNDLASLVKDFPDMNYLLTRYPGF